MQDVLLGASLIIMGLQIAFLVLLLTKAKALARKLEFQRGILAAIMGQIIDVIPHDSPLRTENPELRYEQMKRFFKAMRAARGAAPPPGPEETGEFAPVTEAELRRALEANSDQRFWFSSQDRKTKR